MSVDFLEMELIEGKLYKDSNGNVWRYSSDGRWYEEGNKRLLSLTSTYTHKQLKELRFYEEVDWSKVPIDTKILVWTKHDEGKMRRYFAGIDSKTGRIKAWSYGATSFSSEETSLRDFAELYKEGDNVEYKKGENYGS